jgi:hypothetical protein
MVLTNLDLEEYADKLGIKLVGIFTKDALNDMPLQNGAYIINLQNDRDEYGNDNMGSHWVCFQKYSNNKCFYFDPFSFPPPVEVIFFLKKNREINKNGIPFNDLKPIQNINSAICGWYCLGCLHFMSNKKDNVEKSLQQWVDMFDEDVEKNKSILQEYLRPL